MHQIRFRLELRPRPRWGSLACSPRPLAGFRGPTSKGREKRGLKGRKEGGREGGEREGREWRKGKGTKDGCPGFAFEIYGHLNDEPKTTTTQPSCQQLFSQLHHMLTDY